MQLNSWLIKFQISGGIEVTGNSKIIFLISQ